MAAKIETTRMHDLNNPNFDLPQIPAGIASFAKLVDPTNQYVFVDKTVLIAQLIREASETILIMRPRRWGKTLNFSMLQHFFAPEVGGCKTEGLFKGLAIESLAGGAYMKHQGQYPVIFLSLKDIKAPNMDRAMESVKERIQSLFKEHRYLLESKRLAPDEIKTVQSFIEGDISDAQAEFSLFTLSRCLYTHTGQRVYIFVDEYDALVMHAYAIDGFDGKQGYLRLMTDFMRSFLSSGLKDNDYCKKGMISGILRISYNDMLSTLNHLDVFNVLNDDVYAPYYGFTAEEVRDYFIRSKRFGTETELENALTMARDHYNGYKIGVTTLYNPWSITNYLKKNIVGNYWTLTGNDELIKRIIVQSHDNLRQDFATLISGQSIKKTITEFINFEALEPGPRDMDGEGIWSLLLYSGYLKIVDAKIGITGESLQELVVPNKEVLTVYRNVLVHWFNLQYTKGLPKLFMALASGDIASFVQQLRHYLETSASVRDFSAEAHYHAFILGMLCGLMTTHIVRSNRESGLGFADIILIPKDRDRSTAIVIEFKHVPVKEEFSDKLFDDATRHHRLRVATEDGFKQAELRRYESEIHHHPHITQAVRVGMAFCGKLIGAQWQTLKLAHGKVAEEGQLQQIFPEDR